MRNAWRATKVNINRKNYCLQKTIGRAIKYNSEGRALSL